MNTFLSSMSCKLPCHLSLPPLHPRTEVSETTSVLLPDVEGFEYSFNMQDLIEGSIFIYKKINRKAMSVNETLLYLASFLVIINSSIVCFSTMQGFEAKNSKLTKCSMNTTAALEHAISLVIIIRLILQVGKLHHRNSITCVSKKNSVAELRSHLFWFHSFF